MNKQWLKERLRQLNITHEEFAERLKARDIRRTRATITGWVNGKPISILSHPKTAKKLADALEYKVDEMLLAIGYEIGHLDLDIPDALAAHIRRFNRMTASQQREFLKTFDFLVKIVRQVPEGGIPSDSE